MKRLATVFTLSAFGGFVASEEFNPYQANDDYYDNYDYGYEDGFERSAEPSGPKSSPVTTSDVNQIYNSTSARNTTPCPSTPARQDGFAGQCAFESFADATDDFEEVTVDCHGNALPNGQKWYKAKNPFSGKENSFFHAPTGFNHWWDAYNFCHGDGMPAGSHMWCPTSEVESAWMWLHHPDQPFDPYGNDGSGTQGLWTGISTPYKRDPIYFCDLTRNSHTYFNWADSEPDQKLQKWVMLDFMSWKMVDLTRHTDNLGSFLCEVNCDILSTCEALNCANSDATCQDNGDVASSQCVCNDPAYEWDRASLSCVLINPVVNFNIPLESTAGMRSLLEEVLTAKGLQPVFDDIMDHGCHCVRIDRALSGLGGIGDDLERFSFLHRACSLLLLHGSKNLSFR